VEEVDCEGGVGVAVVRSGAAHERRKTRAIRLVAAFGPRRLAKQKKSGALRPKGNGLLTTLNGRSGPQKTDNQSPAS
jgi:hypothetical protein